MHDQSQQVRQEKEAFTGFLLCCSGEAPVLLSKSKQVWALSEPSVFAAAKTPFMRP
jgi:hypothetical protein